MAPPGSGLLVSVLLRPDLPRDRWHLLTVATALAAADTCMAHAGFSPELKWPNDLLVADRKLAGILAETDGDCAVVGLGLNLNWPSVVPAEVAHLAIGANQVARRSLDRDVFLDAFLHELGTRVVGLRDPAALADEYRRRCSTIGRDVRVVRPDGELLGRALDVTDEGHLVVDAAGEKHTVAAGDVTHLR